MRLTVFIALTLLVNTARATLSNAKLQVIKTIVAAADKVEVPRELLLAICYTESGFRTSGVTHQDGTYVSIGVCQIQLPTALYVDKVYKHKHKATENRLHDTYTNAFYAAKFLKLKLKQYNNNWYLAADAYNKNNAVSENTEYVKAIKRYLAVYK